MLPLIWTGGGVQYQPAGDLVVAIAVHGHPHLPKDQIPAINSTEYAVLAHFLDEVLHAASWLNIEQ